MTGRVITEIRIEGAELVVTLDGVTTTLPTGTDPLSRLQHVARSMLTGRELEVFEYCLELGCAGLIVRETEK